MDSNDKYLTHNAGLYALFAWMTAQEESGMPCHNQGQIIYLNPLISRYFSLGVCNKKGLEHLPFLAIQPMEKKWISLIQWDCAVIKEKDNFLYLIAQFIKGDGSNFPDIPSFAIAFEFDTASKLDLIKDINCLQGREYAKDYVGQINVNFHNTIFSLPVKHELEENNFELPESLTYEKLMFQNEKALLNDYLDGEPEFKGDLAAIPGTESLFEKLKKKLL